MQTRESIIWNDEIKWCMNYEQEVFLRVTEHLVETKGVQQNTRKISH